MKFTKILFRKQIFHASFHIYQKYFCKRIFQGIKFLLRKKKKKIPVLIS